VKLRNDAFVADYRPSYHKGAAQDVWKSDDRLVQEYGVLS
jgi:hypothetical protein